MRLCLLSYFDLGVSYGLGDSVFKPETTSGTVPDILNIGIRNPLCEGVVFRLQDEAPEVFGDWTERAARLVDAEAMDNSVLGFVENEVEPTLTEFKKYLADLIRSHRVATVELTIYGIGIVLLYLELAPGIPLRYALGIIKCYEFAAYERGLSESLAAAAKHVADQSLFPGGDVLVRLTRRPVPEIRRDAEGREESCLFTAFSRIVLCIDRDDEPKSIAKAMFPAPANNPNADITQFHYDYHGVMYYDWAGCLIAPPSGTEANYSRQVIARMMESLRIGNAFLGACEAFEKLFLDQTLRQAETFLRGGSLGLSSRDLNRLRTLALAVVSLTNFAPVAVATEDQEFFKRFEADAGIKARHAVIQTRSEILYNVQQAEAQAEDTERMNEDERRQGRLGLVVLVLTGLTFISILVDSYNFVKGGGAELVTDLQGRFWIVAALGLSIVTILLILTSIFRPSRTSRS